MVKVVGDERNKGQWKKARVEELVKGRDDVVRGVLLRHKGHLIERPVQAVCPLEIGGQMEESLTVGTIKGAIDGKVNVIAADIIKGAIDGKVNVITREKRRAAVNAEAKTRLLLEED